MKPAMKSRRQEFAYSALRLFAAEGLEDEAWRFLRFFSLAPARARSSSPMSSPESAIARKERKGDKAGKNKGSGLGVEQLAVKANFRFPTMLPRALRYLITPPLTYY
jgi:hypothetical protein